MWSIPWTFNEVIDFIFLVVSTGIVAAIPVVYGWRANLRDPLARAVVTGTGSTALVFVASVAFTVAMHAGWNPPEQVLHWIIRCLYLTVAVGKSVLLIAILRALREVRRSDVAVSRNGLGG